jgi:phosphoribosylaminoimidazole carboxylase PurE protein
MIGKPVVGIVMGSDSDMEVMQRCMAQLESLEIPFEVRIISAHRTPDVAHEYGAMAAKRGLKVLIAAAGMSAALGGVLASKSTLPVIGVPVNSGPLNGIDAALSTMQMPPGVPVACMSIGAAGATNAAILAAQILATYSDEVAARLRQLKEEMAKKVLQKDAALRRKPPT